MVAVIISVDPEADAAVAWFGEMPQRGLVPGPTPALTSPGTAILSGLDSEGRLSQVELLGVTRLLADTSEIKTQLQWDPDADEVLWQPSESAAQGATRDSLSMSRDDWLCAITDADGHLVTLVIRHASRRLDSLTLDAACVVWPDWRRLEAAAADQFSRLARTDLGSKMGVVAPRLERWGIESAGTYSSLLCAACSGDSTTQGDEVAESVYIDGEAMGSPIEIATRLARRAGLA